MSKYCNENSGEEWYQHSARTILCQAVNINIINKCLQYHILSIQDTTSSITPTMLSLHVSMSMCDILSLLRPPFQRNMRASLFHSSSSFDCIIYHFSYRICFQSPQTTHTMQVQHKSWSCTVLQYVSMSIRTCKEVLCTFCRILDSKINMISCLDKARSKSERR